MMTKEQWIESVYGDLTMDGKISKDSAIYKAMMNRLDKNWQIVQNLHKEFTKDTKE